MIICAAVRIKMKDSGNIATIHCMRHHYAFETLHDLGIKPKDYERVDEGFILNRKKTGDFSHQMNFRTITK